MTNNICRSTCYKKVNQISAFRASSEFPQEFSSRMLCLAGEAGFPPPTLVVAHCSMILDLCRDCFSVTPIFQHENVWGAQTWGGELQEPSFQSPVLSGHLLFFNLKLFWDWNIQSICFISLGEPKSQTTCRPEIPNIFPAFLCCLGNP